MKYLHTKTLDGAVIILTPNDIVIAVVVDHYVWFYCTAGYKSCYYTSLKWVNTWLDENQVQHFKIASHTSACRPHVMGCDSDGHVIFHPEFFNHLPEESKKLFREQTISKSYRTQLHTGSDNYYAGKEKRKISKEKKNEVSNTKLPSSQMKTDDSTIKKEKPAMKKKPSREDK
jgi:hypothetical protein